MSSRKAQFLFMSTLLILLSFAYQYWLYPKLLDTVTPTQSLSDFTWHSNSNVLCDSENSSYQCRLTPNKPGINRFVGTLPLSQSKAADFLAIFDLDFAVQNHNTESKLSRYKVVLISEKKGYRQWSQPHRVLWLDASQSWDGQERLFYDKPVDNFELFIEIPHADSSVIIQDFTLIQGKETQLLKILQGMLIAFWVLLFLVVMRCILKAKTRWGLILIVLMSVILAGTQISNSLLSPVSKWFTDRTPPTMQKVAIPEVVSTVIKQPKINPTDKKSHQLVSLKKVAHFILFALFTLLLWLQLANTKLRMFWVTTFALLFAIATEAMQALGGLRTASMIDVGIDFTGIVLMLLLIVVVRTSSYLNPKKRIH